MADMHKKEEDFSDWYLDIVEKANLSDKRYPIKGMNVWTPYGWKIMRQIDTYIRQEFDATGHDEVCFPLMIPETEFAKEKEHIKGFDNEVYWVTHAGQDELDVRLVVRPTSETAIYPMYSLWIRSHQDLPMKTYQIVNTFRYETKQTRPFIRVREIHFFESHTCHATEEEGEVQVKEDLAILERLAKAICLPYMLCIRTEWDKFPGAYYTVGIDTIMPNGRTLQMGSVHHYRTNFSVPYNITYEDENGEHKYVHQTTMGMSERLVGALVGVHGDDQGLVMPPGIAPFQCVIIPIFKKDSAAEVAEAAMALAHVLKDAGIRVKLDDSDARPGAKYYEWEMKGVPVRLELGARDIAEGVVSFARRDTGEKGSIAIDSVVPGVKLLLDEISDNMLAKAKEYQASMVVDVDSTENLPDDRVLRIGWCGCEECGHRFEDTTGFKILGRPYIPEPYSGKCIVCGKPVDQAAYAAHTM